MDSIFSVDDLAIEILSRLPIEDVSRFKCNSKKWNKLICSPSFLRIHGNRSNDILGLFIQACREDDHNPERLGFYSFHKTNECRMQIKRIKENIPFASVLMSSNNGLVCFRSSRVSEETACCVYVWNPITNDRVGIGPVECGKDDCFLMSVYPFSFCPSFKVVNIRRSKDDKSFYSFVIYSSKTGSWMTSKEICYCEYDLDKSKQVFVNGRFHWLTLGHCIITFDAEQEKSDVIKIPGNMVPHWYRKMRILGESHGYLHYVQNVCGECKIWRLLNYFKPEWVLQHCFNIIEFSEEHLETIGPRQKGTGHYLDPLSYHEDTLIMRHLNFLMSYNFKTRSWWDPPYFLGNSVPHLRYDLPTAIPYSRSLAAMNIFRPKRISSEAPT